MNTVILCIRALNTDSLIRQARIVYELSVQPSNGALPECNALYRRTNAVSTGHRAIKSLLFRRDLLLTNSYLPYNSCYQLPATDSDVFTLPGNLHAALCNCKICQHSSICAYVNRCLCINCSTVLYLHRTPC